MKYETELPIQFADYDVLGHVNNTVYLRYMETARVRLINHLVPRSRWYRVPLVVVSARCEFQRAIRDADRAKIMVWASRIGGRSWDFDYEIITPDAGVSAIGRTTQVAYDHDEDAMVEINDDLRTRLEDHQETPLAFR